MSFHWMARVLHGESMVRLQLDDRKWAKIAAILAQERSPGRRGNDNRKFVEAVLWWRRTGVPPSHPIGHPPLPLPLSGTGTGTGTFAGVSAIQGQALVPQGRNGAPGVVLAR